MKTQNKVKDFLVKLFLFGLGSAVALILLEIGVRVAVPTWYPRGAFSADPLLGYVNTSDFTYRLVGREFDVGININGEGFRDTPWTPVLHNQPVVFAAGDSFCYGYGVHYDKTFLSLLEQQLKARIIKGCTCGYGTFQEALLLESRIDRYRPDLIRLSFFIGNDVYENAGVRNLTVRDGYFHEEPPENAGLLHKLITWTRNRSRLFELVISTVKQSVPLFQFLKHYGLAGDALIDENDLYRPEESPKVQVAYQATEAYLDRIAATARQRNIPVAVVLIPTRRQVEPGSLVTEPGVDPSRPNRRLRQMMTTRGMKVIDLLPVMQERFAAAPNKSFYFVYDSHWNSMGHTLAAEAAARSLADLLPDRPDQSGLIDKKKD